MAQLSIVVRHTFLEIEDALDAPTRRSRALSDSCLLGCEFDLSRELDLESCNDRSTSAGSCAGDISSVDSTAGDESPRSSFHDAQIEEASWSVCEDAKQGGHHWPSKKKNVVVSVQKVENRTTIMLRNLPSSFTRSQLLDILDGKGLRRKYDFVYLPIDFVSGASLGYAFVNLIDTDIANCAMQCLDGFSAWAGTTSQKVMGACWSDPHQGLSMLVERFRNSRVMHPIIPDEYRPALFNEGKRLPFPKHTKRIRPPYSGSVQARLSAA